MTDEEILKSSQRGSHGGPESFPPEGSVPLRLVSERRVYAAEAAKSARTWDFLCSGVLPRKRSVPIASGSCEPGWSKTIRTPL